MSSEHKEYHEGEAQGTTGPWDRQPHLTGEIWEDFCEKMTFKRNKNE